MEPDFSELRRRRPEDVEIDEATLAKQRAMVCCV
jgi:hypothetical protein